MSVWWKANYSQQGGEYGRRSGSDTHGAGDVSDDCRDVVLGVSVVHGAGDSVGVGRLMKGRTNQPLSVLIHPELVECKDIKEQLIDKGHSVTVGEVMTEHDLVIGKNAWRMTAALTKYLPLSLKSARAAKREAKVAKCGGEDA